MSSGPTFRAQLAKTFVIPLLCLFLLPSLGYFFVQHAIPEIDAKILAAIERSIDKDSILSVADKRVEKAFFRDHLPSSVCGSADARLVKYREGVCARYSELWQFKVAGRVTLAALVAGGLTLFAVVTLGALAFLNRRVQHLSFVAGWRLLVLVSAVEVIVQGALAVWLSFWGTAFFTGSYYPKLILLIGVLVALAAFTTVSSIFKRVPPDTKIGGELLTEGHAPALWARVRSIAAKLRTPAPDQILAGIDSNFFVTQAPLTVNGKHVQGRSLYVSLPLLRVLDRHEADAVLSHELAHLRGGDTASSAALGPRLAQYDHYCHMMQSVAATLPVYYLMQLFRVIFEFALKRESREREFVADRTSAALVSAQVIIQSLIKIGAYANYRARIEARLFEHDQQHSEALGIAQFVASGLTPYASSAEFLEEMKSANVPHPFDSHPSLGERMANVAHQVDEKEFGRIVSSMPTESWIAYVPNARDIEQRLWSDYEKRFAAVHEQNLAYRYEPANQLEQALVLKYFPPIKFELRAGKRIELTYAGPILPGQTEALSWDKVANLRYEDGYGGDVLHIDHPEKGLLGAKSSKVKLPGIRKERARFKEVLGYYWNRHQFMRQHMTKKRAAASMLPLRSGDGKELEGEP